MRIGSIGIAESDCLLPPPSFILIFFQSRVVVAHPPSARKHASPDAGCHSNPDTFKLSLLL